MAGRVAERDPHEVGKKDEWRREAVTNAAYDQVRSTAERGTPVLRSNCSAREPSAGVYFSATSILFSVSMMAKLRNRARFTMNQRMRLLR